MGFVEETGAAQHFRDAKITQIYEGTNGIQAIDLAMRKLPLSGGEAVKALVSEMRGVVAEVEAANTPGFGHSAARLKAAVDSLERATDWMLATMGASQAEALAGATPYLKLFALAQGGTGLAKKALAMRSEEGGLSHLATCRFFAEHLATEAPALELAVDGGCRRGRGFGRGLRGVTGYPLVISLGTTPSSWATGGRPGIHYRAQSLPYDGSRSCAASRLVQDDAVFPPQIVKR